MDLKIYPLLLAGIAPFFSERAEATTLNAPTQRIDSVWSSPIGSDVVNERTLFIYNEKGVQMQKVNYVLLTGLESYWIPNTKEVYGYDESGKRDLYEKYVWSTQLGVWTGESRYQRIYKENSNLTDSIFYYTWEGIQWKTLPDKAAWTYENENKLATEILYRWRENYDTDQMEWMQTERREYEFDERENILSKTLSTWNLLGKQWRYSDQWTYVYDEHNNPISWAICIWRSTTNKWGTPQNYKAEYTYNEFGDKITEQQYNQAYDGSWKPAKNYQYTYFYGKNTIAKTTPYLCGFDTADEFAEYTVIDANEDGITWKYEPEAKSARYGMNPEQKANDWLFTPAIYLTNEKRYRITFKAKNQYSVFEEKIQVRAGNSPTVEAMSFQVLEETPIQSSQYKSYTGTIIVPVTGVYYFGFLACSNKDQYGIDIDDIKITEDKDLTVPTMVEDLYILAGENGAEKATVCFYVPTRRMSGHPLQNVTKVEIYKGNASTPVKVYENPLKGDIVMWEDQDVKTGLYSYSVIAYNDEGASDVAVASAFIGLDYPTAVTNVVIKEQKDGCALSWDAPTRGLYNGYLDPSQVKYKLYRNNVLLNDAVETTSYLDNSVNTQAGQQMIEYKILAYNATGNGQSAITSSIFVGVPYDLPFLETFANGVTGKSPWGNEQIYYFGSWSLRTEGVFPDTYAFDQDGGLATFNSMFYPEGSCGRLSSPKIDLSNADKPTLSFYMFHVAGAAEKEEKMVVEISVDKQSFTPITDSISVYAESMGWTLHSVDLSEFKGSNDIRVGFTATGQGVNNIHLDRIELADVNPTSIGEIQNELIKVIGETGAILIKCDDTNQVIVSSIEGRLHFNAAISATTRIALERGVYMVQVAEKQYKVYVK